MRDVKGYYSKTEWQTDPEALKEGACFVSVTRQIIPMVHVSGQSANKDLHNSLLTSIDRGVVRETTLMKSALDFPIRELTGNISQSFHKNRQHSQGRDFINGRQLAKDLCIAYKSVMTMVSKDQIPYRRIGRRVLFRLSEINRWIDSGKAESLEVLTKNKEGRWQL